MKILLFAQPGNRHAISRHQQFVVLLCMRDASCVSGEIIACTSVSFTKVIFGILKFSERILKKHSQLFRDIPMHYISEGNFHISFYDVRVIFKLCKKKC